MGSSWTLSLRRDSTLRRANPRSAVTPHGPSVVRRSGFYEVHRSGSYAIHTWAEAVQRVRAMSAVIQPAEVSDFVAEHGLAGMLLHAEMEAARIFGRTRVQIPFPREVDVDLETGEPFLNVRVNVFVPESTFLSLESQFLDEVWSPFEDVDPERILFFVDIAPAN